MLVAASSAAATLRRPGVRRKQQKGSETNQSETKLSLISLVRGATDVEWACLGRQAPAARGAANVYLPLFGLIRYFAPVARLPYTAISSRSSACASEISLV